jgi:hypothetical protein
MKDNDEITWDIIKKKISSRKFWESLIGFITSILVAFNVPDNQIAQTASIIMGFGVLVVYILSEAKTDQESIRANTSNEEIKTMITETKVTQLNGKAEAKEG